MKVLILGGTTEGSALARALEPDHRFQPILSLAGRTRTPVLPAIPSRRGGFGGIPGLTRYLQDEGIAALIDATHPFARQMHHHAAAAAREANVPRLVISRPPWTPIPGDQWLEVPDMPAAAHALGPTRRKVLLTIGQQELAPFRQAPWHDYLIRSVEPPDPTSIPEAARYISARGPFTLPGEHAFLAREGIEIMVTKNSGGEAVAAKLEAARTLHMPVIMVARPPPPPPPTVADVPSAVAWLHQRALRGVYNQVPFA